MHGRERFRLAVSALYRFRLAGAVVDADAALSLCATSGRRSWRPTTILVAVASREANVIKRRRRGRR
jgi:hypothetical protein